MKYNRVNTTLTFSVALAGLALSVLTPVAYGHGNNPKNFSDTEPDTTPDPPGPAPTPPPEESAGQPNTEVDGGLPQFRRVLVPRPGHRDIHPVLRAIQLVDALGLGMVGVVRHPVAQFLVFRAVGGRVQVALRQQVSDQARVAQSRDALVRRAPLALFLKREDLAVERGVPVRKDARQADRREL